MFICLPKTKNNICLNCWKSRFYSKHFNWAITIYSKHTKLTLESRAYKINPIFAINWVFLEYFCCFQLVEYIGHDSDKTRWFSKLGKNTLKVNSYLIKPFTIYMLNHAPPNLLVLLFLKSFFVDSWQVIIDMFLNLRFVCINIQINLHFIWQFSDKQKNSFLKFKFDYIIYIWKVKILYF